MKTKAQKQEAITQAEGYLKTAAGVTFVDFSKLTAEDLRSLRRGVAVAGAKLFVIKKRLLNVIFKQQGIDMDMGQFKVSVGTIFAPAGVESVAGPVFRFFKEKATVAGLPAQTAQEKILGGYDMVARSFISSETVTAIGQLPPREVLLGQLFGTIAGPIRAFLYILDQKSKQTN